MEDLIDDLWIEIICLLNPHDFLTIAITNKHFNNLTNRREFRRINLYWKYQSQLLCQNINSTNYTPDDNDWYLLFQELLCYFLVIPATETFEFGISNQTYQFFDTVCITNINENIISDSDITHTNNNHDNDEMELMIDYAICINIENALYYACIHDILPIFKLLLFIYGRNNTNTGNTSNHNCKNNIQSTDNIDINGIYCWPFCLQDQKTQILDIILRENSIKIGRYLLNPNNFGNIDLTVRYRESEDGDTALIVATEWGRIEFVELLLKHPNMTAQCINMGDIGENYTALHCASLKHRSIIAKLLVNDKRTNVNVQDIYLHTPLMEAIKYDSIQVANILLDHEKIDPALRNKYGVTVLNMDKIKRYPQLIQRIEQRILKQIEKKLVLSFNC